MRLATWLIVIALTFAPQLAVASSRAPFNVVFLNPAREGETFWDLVTLGMRLAARQLSVNLEVVYAGRNTRLMDRLGREIIARSDKPDFLILVNEEGTIAPLLVAANAAGLRTFLLSNSLTPAGRRRYGAPRTSLKSWVGSLEPDMHDAGLRMGRTLVEQARRQGLVSGDGKIHILALGGDQRTPNSIERNRGLGDYVASQRDVVVDRFLFANWNRDEARALTSRYLIWARRSGIRVAGIWSANDPMAFGAIEAARQESLEPGRDLNIVGLNWSPDAIDRIRDGQMLMSDGGHVFGGAFAMVMLRDYVDGCDFARPDAETRFSLAALNSQTPAALTDMLRARAYDRIDFTRFLARQDGTCGTHDFSLARLLAPQRQPAHGN